MKQATKKPRSSPAAESHKLPGEIRPESLYRLDELSGRSGLGTWALRTLRRAGLKVYRFGGRGFVRGADFIAAILAADGEDGGRR